MFSRVRLVVSIWLALMLPLQGILVLTAQMQGPVHTHQADRTYDDDPDLHDHVDDNHHHADDHHHHAHLDKERHFHAHDESGVVIDVDDQQESLALENTLQKPGSASLVFGLIPTRALPAIPDLHHCANATRMLAFATRTLPRIERPPSGRHA